MPVVEVGQDDSLDEGLQPGDQRVREGGSHRLCASLRPSVSEFGVDALDGCGRLVEDAFAPQRAIEVVLDETQERVGQSHRNQDAGIEQRRVAAHRWACSWRESARACV